MSNVLIAYNNRADECALSGGAWQSTLPLSNLKTRALALVARTTDLTPAATKFDAALAKSRLIRVVSLVNHNLSTQARYRITFSLSPDFASLAHDTGWAKVWQPLWLPSQLDWEDDNWWEGTLSEEQRAGYRWNLIRLLPASVRARYVRIELDDPGNSDGYVQIGRLFLADAWQPANNMAYGASLGYEDISEVQATQSGAEIFNAKPRYRVARFTLGFMDEGEALGNAFELDRQMGVTGEVLYAWNPDDTLHALRRSFLGRMRQLSAIEHPYFNIHSKAFEIKELL